MSCARARVVAVKVHAEIFAAALSKRCVCVYYCRTFYKAVRVGEEESGGHGTPSGLLSENREKFMGGFIRRSFSLLSSESWIQHPWFLDHSVGPHRRKRIS